MGKHDNKDQKDKKSKKDRRDKDKKRKRDKHHSSSSDSSDGEEEKRRQAAKMVRQRYLLFCSPLPPPTPQAALADKLTPHSLQRRLRRWSAT